MDRILRGLGVAYLVVGFVFAVVRPTESDTDRLMSTSTGRACEAPLAGVVLLWPIYMNYYYGGGFSACKSSSAK